MLTDQAKQNFDKWLYAVYFKEYYQYQMIWQLMGESARNGVYLEWFDGVDKITFNEEFYKIYRKSLISNDKASILIIITEAIKKANEIYNTRQLCG